LPARTQGRCYLLPSGAREIRTSDSRLRLERWVTAACGKTAPDLDGRAYVTATTSAANIRTGSSTSCLSIGSLVAGQRIDYYCFTHTSTYTWSYLRDIDTGKVGWVRDDLLPGDGSTFYCGF
jgi:uncharacterized protein YraI